MLWDNTRPMKGIRTIRIMNEYSFTHLLAISFFSVERNFRTVSSRFATSHIGGIMRSRNLLRIVLACLLLTGMVYAQGVGASGDIKGTVTDPQGAVVANATVTAIDVEKGIKHTVTTDNNGQYRLTGMSPATYSVSVSKSGFQPEVAKNVV